jgi:arginase
VKSAALLTHAETPAQRDVTFVLVPIDSGIPQQRRGRGPDALVEAGVLMNEADAMKKVVRLLPETRWHAELATTFRTHHRVAAEVRTILAEGNSPLVLAGDCSATVGVVAGLGNRHRTGVLWFDAHGDFNTPETDQSGFLDGQGLAMLTGRCWIAHTSSLPSFEPVPDHRIALVGARDLEEAESRALDDSDILRLRVEDVAEAGATAAVLDELCRDVDQFHIHFDADVLDTSLGRASDWAMPGGLTLDQVMALIRETTARRPIVSAVVASWDPAADDSGRMQAALLAIMNVLAGAVRHG